MASKINNDYLLQQKNYIISEIAKAYSSHYNTKYSSRNKKEVRNMRDIINISCNAYPDNTCQKCLDTFLNVNAVYPCIAYNAKCPSTGRCVDGRECVPGEKNSCLSNELCYMKEVCPSNGVCRNGEKCTPGSQECSVCSNGTPCKVETEMMELTKKLGGTVGIYGVGDPEGVCASSCQCNLSNVVMENTLILTSDDIAETPLKEDVDAISKTSYQEIVSKYPDVDYDSYRDTVQNIINNIHQDVSQNLYRTVYSTQTINLRNGSAYNINMYVMMNTVMGSIMKSSTSMQFLNKLSDKMIEDIKIKINKNIMGNFEYIWQQGKLYFIGTGIGLLIMVLLIIWLLIYRALHGSG